MAPQTAIPTLFDEARSRRRSDSMSGTIIKPPAIIVTGDTTKMAPRPCRRQLLTAIILLGLMFSCIDTCIVSTALVNISTAMQDYLNASWAVLAYLLTYMSFTVGFSKLSDIYGRRNLCIVAWVFFSGFSIGCALARSMPQLIAARALQGIGGSGLYALSQTCLVEQGPARPELVGALIGITLAASYVIGPVLGGVITSYWSWRGIFWINVPAGAIALIGIFALWPQDRRRHRLGVWAAFTKIDFPGNILLVVASFLLIFAIQQAGTLVWSWNSPAAIACLVISGLSWAFLFAWEVFLGTRKESHVEPLFPVHLFTGRVYPALVITTAFTGFLYVALVIEIPERLQLINGDSAVLAGVHLLPMLGACASGSFVAGIITKKLNRAGETLIAGTVLQVLAACLLYLSSDSETNIRSIFGFTAIYGLGAGLVFAAGTIMTIIEAHNDDLASAQGVVSQARVLGGAIGLAVCTIIFNSMAQSELGGGELTPEELDELHRSPMALLNLPTPELRDLVRAVYTAAFQSQMLSMLCVAAAGVAASLFAYRCKSLVPFSETLTRHQEGGLAGQGPEASQRARAQGGQAQSGSDTELENLGSVQDVRRYL